MVTEANGAFGLALRGLSKHATAAALGAIRIVAETLAWAGGCLRTLTRTRARPARTGSH